jgi:proline iminopeptidase
MDPIGYIPVEGGNVWYKIVGADKPGTPLLTLHGGPGYPHDYLEPLEQLADARPVIFYDQLGCGKSDHPPDRALWRIERFVRELTQVRQALGFASTHLFAHSWGTMLAVDYLLTGASVTSLILASPALSIPRWMADADRLRQTLPADVQETLARHEAAGTTSTRQYRDATLHYYRRHLCRMDPWPEPMNRSHEASSGVIYREMWGPSELCATGNLMNYDETARLCEIAVPTLYTCGRYDEATPEATAWYRSLTPAAEMQVFEHSAHMPHLEEADAYLAALRRFLDQLNGETPSVSAGALAAVTRIPKR